MVADHNAEGVGLAEAIKLLRQNRGLSARQLSLKAGLSSSYVGKLEAREIEPSVRAFAQIAQVLGMSQREIALCVVMERLRESPPT